MEQPPVRHRRYRKQRRKKSLRFSWNSIKRMFKLEPATRRKVQTVLTISLTLLGIWLVYRMAPRFLDME